MNDARIGRQLPDKSDWPEKTICGQDYTPPHAGRVNLGNDYFAVIDVFYPPNFDMDATLKELKAIVARESKVKGAPPNEPQKPGKET